MAGRLTKKGVKRLFLVGGSIGGHMSIVAATRLKKPAAAVVSLSGFAATDEVAPLDVPLLQITAENDPSLTPSTVEEIARAAVNSPDRPVVIVRGEGAHASKLFETAQSQMVLDTIMAFLAKYDG
jgi:dienelactone hydrolase